MSALLAFVTRRTSLHRVPLKSCLQSSRGYSWIPDSNISRIENDGKIIQGKVAFSEADLCSYNRGKGLNGLVSVEGVRQPGILSVGGMKPQVLVPERKILVPGGAQVNQKIIVPKKAQRYNCYGFPEYKDWRSSYSEFQIPKISDQCGTPTCWAHAAACAIEWMHLIRTGERIEVSRQQFIDYDVDNCSDAYVALRRAMETGVASVETYPYVDGLRGKRKYVDSIIKVNGTRGWNCIYKYNYLELMQLLQEGPAVVWARIEEDKMFEDDKYNINKPGTFRYPAYGVPNHMMVCVGYDFRAEPYWILQNSWNESHANCGYLHYGQRGYPDNDDQFGFFPFICHRPI